MSLPITLFYLVQLTCARATEMTRYPVWKFESPSGPVSYLVPTVHVAHVRLAHIPELKALIETADTLLIEGSDPLESGFGNAPELLDFTPPSKKLSPGALKRIRAFAAHAGGIPHLHFTAKKLEVSTREVIPPVILASLYELAYKSTIPKAELDAGEIFDQQIISAFGAQRKVIHLDPTLVLDSVYAEHVPASIVNRVIMDSVTAEGHLSDVVRADLGEIHAKSNDASLIAGLFAHDDFDPARYAIAWRSELQRSLERVEPFIRARHAKWLARVVPKLHAKSSIVAGGLAHLLDSHVPGLARLLEAHGTVTKLDFPYQPQCQTSFVEGRSSPAGA